jgi:hypothetical protein
MIDPSLRQRFLNLGLLQFSWNSRLLRVVNDYMAGHKQAIVKNWISRRLGGGTRFV